MQFYLSGAVEVHVDDSPVALGGPKQRCVLAVLLAHHGTVVSIDRLIDAVWGDAAPPKALVSLRSYIANLRRILDPTAEPNRQRLVSHSHGYQLNLLRDDSVDLFRFESLVAAGRDALIRQDAGAAVGMLHDALALWRGDPFGVALTIGLVVFLLVLFATKYRHGSNAVSNEPTVKTWRWEVGWTAITLLLFVGLAVWGGLWLREPRLRELLPLRA